MREMLYEAAYWRPNTERPELEDGLRRPDLQKLLAGWGREGDTAVIAESADGSRVGAAWYRFWTSEDHSYGFVDNKTPELGIAVHPAHRRHGIGRELLRSLLPEAKTRGVKQISLSVEADNPARQLYLSLGFRKLHRVGGAWTMVIDLDRLPDPSSASRTEGQSLGAQ